MKKKHLLKGFERNPSVLRNWGSGAHKKLKGKASYDRKAEKSVRDE